MPVISMIEWHVHPNELLQHALMCQYQDHNEYEKGDCYERCQQREMRNDLFLHILFTKESRKEREQWSGGRCAW